MLLKAAEEPKLASDNCATLREQKTTKKANTKELWGRSCLKTPGQGCTQRLLSSHILPTIRPSSGRGQSWWLLLVTHPKAGRV